MHCTKIVQLTIDFALFLCYIDTKRYVSVTFQTVKTLRYRNITHNIHYYYNPQHPPHGRQNMPQNSQNEKNEGKRKNTVLREKGSGKIKKYHEIITFSPNLPKTAALIQAGYSSKTHADDIEATGAFKALQVEHQQVVDSLKIPIAERIKQAQERTGFNAALCLRRIKQIVHTGKDRDAAAAVKVGTEISGERMPEQHDYNVTGDSTILTRLMQ